MRTTVDIPQELRTKLIQEATSRNLRGFSPVIVEALRLYFNRQRRNRQKTIERLKGCLTAEQLVQERARLTAVRDNWRR